MTPVVVDSITDREREPPAPIAADGQPAVVSVRRTATTLMLLMAN